MIREKVRCVDLFYLVVTSLFFFGFLGWAIYHFNLEKLNNLSMPTNKDGETCWNQATQMYNYVRINGPSILDRDCVSYCAEQELNRKLGGICLDARVQYILKNSGQYSQYIQTKLNSLSRIKIVGITLAISIGLAMALMLFYELMSCCCSLSTISNLIIIFSLIVSPATLYFLFPVLSLPVWITLCVLLFLYMTYVVVWKISRKKYSLEQSNKKVNDDEIKKTILFRLLLTLMMDIITFGLIAVILFQYMAFMSSSPAYKWTSPNLYLQVNSISYNQVVLIVQILYLIIFTQTMHQYLIGSLHTNSLGIVNALYTLFRCHLGSVCKLSMVRLIFAFPIFLLTLIKPVENEKCADCCHCLCGWVLNLARKYSLPIHAYQSAMKQVLNVEEASHRLHYQTHINNYEYSEGYLDKIGALIIISCSAIGCVLFLQNYLVNLPINLITLILAIFSSIWMSSFFVSSWIHAKEGDEVKQICQANRVQFLQ